MDWVADAPVLLAAFLASLVEVVEAFTIVLAVALVRGWRPALAGVLAALTILALIVLALGPVLMRVPVILLQMVIGVLLLLFGMGWLRKASLRYAGILPMHDEASIFAGESSRIRAETGRALSWIGGIAAFKAVLLEGLEVAFIVVAVGAGRGLIWPAAIGALAACALVLVVGTALHRPLTRVPENALKFGVGVITSAFGVFWTGEGLGIHWPGEDLAILAFVALFGAAGWIAILLARRATGQVA